MPLKLTDDQVCDARSVAYRLIEQATTVLAFSGMEGTTGTEWYIQYHRERLLSAIHELAGETGFRLVPLTAEEIKKRDREHENTLRFAGLHEETA